MTERELREKVVSTAKAYIGTEMGDDKHHHLVDTYNSHKPLARGYPLKYTDDWCSAFVSAIAIKCGMTSIIPTEVSCGRHVELFQKLGEWVESDKYRPAPGDLILYDWDDSGRGDNRGWPDHIGFVEKVKGDNITAIEGNMGSPSHVGRRIIPIGNRYIRGFGVPDYAKMASKKPSSGSGKPPRKPVKKDVALPDVRLGDKHPAARRAMALLRYRGYLPDDHFCGVGAVFDRDAEDATKAFQKKNKIKADGWIGPITWYQLIAD